MAACFFPYAQTYAFSLYAKLHIKRTIITVHYYFMRGEKQNKLC